MTTPTLMYGRRHQRGWNTITAVAMTAFHVLAVAAFFFIDTGAIITAIVLYFVAGMLGIGMAYHRLLTHRSYKTYKWIEYFLTFCATHLLGRHPPHPPSEVRPRGRPALAARGTVVGAHGMDSHR
jgi:stearoyl-CoA desaturase (delta-9 desaturase)